MLIKINSIRPFNRPSQKQRQSYAYSSDAGMGMIPLAILVMSIGFFIVAAIKFYDIYREQEAMRSTTARVEYVQQALRQFVIDNGRYPCPASLTAAPDTAMYGVEVAGGPGFDDCRLDDMGTLATGQTFRSQGIDGLDVRTGAVPVRALHIEDKYMVDGWNSRFIYAVTEQEASPDALLDGTGGDISIVDDNGNQVTSSPGNVEQVVISMGGDDNGAYSFEGQLVQPCNVALRSGVNCDYQVDPAAGATFMSTVNTSRDLNNEFDHKVTWQPPRVVTACDPASIAGLPKDVAFIIDTSGSMASDGFCPSEATCSRMEAAHWAIRRVIPARINANQYSEDPGKTHITGFVGYNTVGNVNDNLGDTVFNDPDVVTEPDFDQIGSDLNDELSGLCPSGSTPLGIHMRAMADQLGDGTEGHPNRITILSDGQNTNGEDPLAVADYIAATYPNMQVDIIDVVGNPSMMEISQRTGGSYYSTDNPDALLDALFDSAGVCGGGTPPAPPPDENSCGL